MKKKLLKERFEKLTELISTDDFVRDNLEKVKEVVGYAKYSSDYKDKDIDKMVNTFYRFFRNDEIGTVYFMLDNVMGIFAGSTFDDWNDIYNPILGLRIVDDSPTDFDYLKIPMEDDNYSLEGATVSEWKTNPPTKNEIREAVEYLIRMHDNYIENLDMIVDDIENENLKENKNMKKVNFKESLVKKMIAKKLRESKMNRKNKRLVKESSDYSTFYHVFGNYTTDNFHRLVEDMIENVEAEDINEDNLYDVIMDEIDTRLIYYDDQWEVLKHYYYPNEIDIFNDAINRLADDMEKCVKMYWDEKDEDEDSEELEEESKKIVKEEKGQESYDARSIAEDIFNDITYNMPKSEDIEEDLERHVAETLDDYFIYSGDIKEMCKKYASREFEKYGLSKAKNIAYENAFGEIMHRLERLVDKWNMEAEEHKEKDEDDEIEDIKKESKESKKSEPRITIRNIEWDTDDEDVDLPKKVEVTMKEVGIDKDMDEDEVVDAISDYLSNEYEWLPISFKYKK